VMQEPDALSAFGSAHGCRIVNYRRSPGLAPGPLLIGLEPPSATETSRGSLSAYASLCRTSMIQTRSPHGTRPKAAESARGRWTSLMPSIMYAEQYLTSGFLLVGQDRARRAGGVNCTSGTRPADVGVQPPAEHGIEGLARSTSETGMTTTRGGVHGPSNRLGGNPNTRAGRDFRTR